MKLEKREVLYVNKKNYTVNKDHKTFFCCGFTMIHAFLYTEFERQHKEIMNRIKKTVFQNMLIVNQKSRISKRLSHFQFNC